MQLVDFNIAKDKIAFEYGDRYFDMHNCFDFVCLRYDVAVRTISFEWQKSAGGWVPEEDPQTIQLFIEGVSFFKVKERDPELPYTEDDCLSSIGFFFDELLDDMENFPVHAIPGEGRLHLSLIFESGLSVKVAAETAALKISEQT